MEAKIKIELKNQSPSEIAELILDGCTASKIVGLTDEFTNLANLSMINVGLTTFDGLPQLHSLREIDLSDNKLSGGLDILVKQCPNLYHINLCANPIKSFTELESLQKLPGLNALDLFDCDITNMSDYRKKVFEMIPHLKYLDGFDVNDVEAQGDDEDDGEDAFAEDADISDEDELEETGEEIGLDYLNSSKVLEDDDSEDFVVNAEKGDHENGNNGAELRAKKRSLEKTDEAANGEPAAKSS